MFEQWRISVSLLTIVAVTTVKVSADQAAPLSDPCAALSSLINRPTVTTSPCVVKPGDLLVETGYTNTTTSGSSAASTIGFPQPSLRVGLGHNFEFDLNPASYDRTTGVLQIGGYSDSALGFKAEFGYTSRVVYGLNILYTLNSGSDAFGGHGDGVLVNANATFVLSPAAGIFASVGYNGQSGGTSLAPERYHNVAPSLGISFALPQNFNLFVEGFGQTSTGPGAGGRYGAGMGVTKDFGSRLQLDAEIYDAGVSGGQHVHSAGFGAGYSIGS